MAASAVTHAKVSAVADDADATLVRPSDWNASHVFATRTRNVPLNFADNIGSVARVSDTHGSFGTLEHLDIPDGVAYIFLFENVIVPADFTGGLQFCIMFSTSVGGGNVEMRHLLQGLSNAGTAAANILDTTDTARAADATANKMVVLKIAATSQPAVGDVVGASLIFTRTAGGDTNTGVLSIWHQWFEYTADS